MFILVFWVAPSVGALGLALHWAFERHGAFDEHGAHQEHGVPGHHGHHGGDHLLAISDLLQVVAHGHHHDSGTVPDHDHDARVDAFAPNLRPNASWVPVLPMPASHVIARVRSLPALGTPIPLFTTHCTLLL